MLFREILGQEALKAKLIAAIQKGRISHAQLYTGNNGFGALPLAIAYAQYLSCEDRGEKDSCGKCRSCIKYAKLSHPDLHFSFPMNKSKEASKINAEEFLPQWREMLLENPYFSSADWNKMLDIENKQGFIGVEEGKRILKKLSLKPYEAAFKILIIWGADKINRDTSNKLLKLIEEPTDKTLIILLSEDGEQLLPTIRSRTQLVRVPPIETAKIARYLEQEKGQSAEAATKLARIAQGDLHFALSKVEKEEEDLYFFNLFKSWMRVCYKADLQGMHKWVEGISAAAVGREKRKRFLVYALEMMREGILRNYAGNEMQRMFDEEDRFVLNFAPFVHAGNVLAMSEILNEAHEHISRNAYAKILFMDLSMKFANLLHVKNVPL